MADPVTIMVIANIAMMAAMYAVTASQTIKGPRLSKEDQKVTLGDPGAAITRVQGKRWVTSQRIQAADLHETKKKTKGKGGKFQQWLYDGSWLDHFTDTPVDAITKIKFDGRLVYQMDGVGVISATGLFAKIPWPPGSPIKLQMGKNFQLYTGDQTSPDAYYEAWCEEKTGMSGMAPAFLGETYAKFHKIPLEKFGNRLPTSEAELIRNAADAFPFETITGPSFSVQGAQFSPDSRLLQVPGPGAGEYSVFDVATRTYLFIGLSSTLGNYAVGEGGDRYGPSSFFDPEVLKQPMGGGETVVADPSPLGGPLLRDTFYANGEIMFLEAGSTTVVYRLGGSSPPGIVAIEIGFDGEWIAGDLDGNVWAAGDNDDGTVSFANCSAIGAPSFTVTTSSAGVPYFFFNNADEIFLYQGGDAFLVDPVAGALLDSASGVAGGSFLPDETFREVIPGAVSIWLGFDERNALDLSLVRTVSLTSWTGGFATNGALYSRLLHALLVKSQFSDETFIFYLDRKSDAGVQLRDLIEEVCTEAGIPSDGFSAAACTQPLPGVTWQQSSARSILDPFLKIFDTIARPHDFTIDFFPRGDGPVDAVDSRIFAKDGTRYDLRRVQGNELPLDVTVVFADMTKEDQKNTAIADQAPEATGSDRRETVDLSTMADTPAGAQQKVDRYLRRLYNSRERLEHALGVRGLLYEPGDVLTVTLDDELTYNMLLEETTHRGIRVDCKLSRDETAIAALNAFTAGAPLDGVDEQEIFVPAVTKGFEIDGPLFRDADNDINPLVYAAAGSYGGSWPGAAAWRLEGGAYDELNATFDTSQASLFGNALDALGSASPWLWDRGNTLDVTIFGGTLTSYTEEELEANAALNLAAIGLPGRWEYLQFATATLLSTMGASRTYRLQGFLRGRRGTEGNVGNHAAGDEILFYNAGDVVVLEYGADEIGGDMSFKTASSGVDPDSAPAVDFTFAGNSLKPYAPVHFLATFDSVSGDWSFTWIRRTRVGGNWSDLTDAPLGEAIEAYELAIPTSTDTRTIASSSASATWTSAMQTADYGAPQTSLPAGIAVYQLGDLVGRGFASDEPIAA